MESEGQDPAGRAVDAHEEKPAEPEEIVGKEDPPAGDEQGAGEGGETGEARRPSTSESLKQKQGEQAAREEETRAEKEEAEVPEETEAKAEPPAKDVVEEEVAKAETEVKTAKDEGTTEVEGLAEPPPDQEEDVEAPAPARSPGSPVETAATARTLKGTRNLASMNNYLEQGKGVLLDSPRSLEVCARNGIAVHSLYFKPFRAFLKGAQGDRTVAKKRHQHWQSRRLEKLELLKSEREMLVQAGEPLPLRGGGFALTAPPMGGDHQNTQESSPPRSATVMGPMGSPRSYASHAPASPPPMSAAASRRREEAAARLVMERAKIRRQVDQARQRQDLLRREEKKAAEAQENLDRRVREQLEHQEKEKARLVKEAQQREKEQRVKQLEYQEQRRKRKEEEKEQQEKLCAEYQAQEEVRLNKLAVVQATREHQEMQRRIANIKKQNQIQSMVQVLTERRAAEIARRHEKAEEIRREFDLQRSQEVRARKATVEARQRELRERLERAKRKEAEAIEKSMERYAQAEERVHKHEQQKLDELKLRRVEEERKEQKRKEHFVQAQRQEAERRDGILAKQAKDQEAKEKLRVVREQALMMRKVEKELSIQDRQDAVERMRMMREYDTEKLGEKIAEKQYRVAEMERQDAVLHRERQRHREMMFKKKIKRQDYTPGPGEYLGPYLPPAAELKGAAAVFGGAGRKEMEEIDGPGPGAYAPRLSLVQPHRSTIRMGKGPSNSPTPLKPLKKGEKNKADPST